LLPSGSITEQTRVVLVNAVYFYGSWVTPFKPSATSDASFQPLSGAAVQVPTMHGEMRVAYRSAGDFEVAELPYEGNQLRMTIVLPTAGKFEAVRSQQSAQWLDQAVTGITATSLRVQLPKFTLTVGPFSLHEGLETLGMKSAFTDQADFTGITTDAPISLSDVLQKAFIAVDENGTEAAAATGAIAGTTAVMQTTPFVVDRPFLFFIRDANGAVLFSGQVVNPTL